MICARCEKNLGGHSIFCPQNPKQGHKWDECVCYVHTCYDAKARRDSAQKGERR